MGSIARRRQHRRIVAAIVILLLATIGVGAQTRSGRADLEGIWTNGTITPLQRPPEFADRIRLTVEEARIYEASFFDRMLNNIASDDDRLLQNDFNDIYQETQTLDRLRTALIVDPPDGRLPAFLPSARPGARRSLDDPESLTLAERCLVANTVGVPHVPNPLGSTYFQFVQTEGWLLIYGESFRLTRVIRIGGTHLPPRVRNWLGDSIGSWEGNTLVVDTTNFRGDTRFQRTGEHLHLTERFTRLDERTLEYRFTVDDPETWERPWTAEVRFRATDARMFDVECHGNDHDRELLLRGARYSERNPGVPRP